MKYLTLIGTCLLLALSACSPTMSTGDTVNTAWAQTQEVQSWAATMVAQTQAAQEQSNTGSNTGDNTAVSAVANIDLNCRYGPDTTYDLVEVMNQGASGTVIAKNSTQNPAWYKLQLENGEECWAGGNNLTITGSVAGLTEITTGFPTPVPIASWWAGTWTIYYNNWQNNKPKNEAIFTAYWNVTGPNSVSGYLSGTPCSSATTTLTISSDGYTATGTQTWIGGACNNLTRELNLRLDPNKNQFRGRMIPIGDPTWSDYYYAGSHNGYPAPEPRR